MIVRLEVRGGAPAIVGRAAPVVSVTVEHGGAEGGGEGDVGMDARMTTEVASECAERILEAMRGDQLKRQVLEALNRADDAGDSVLLLADVAELVEWQPRREVKADGG